MSVKTIFELALLHVYIPDISSSMQFVLVVVEQSSMETSCSPGAMTMVWHGTKRQEYTRHIRVVVCEVVCKTTLTQRGRSNNPPVFPSVYHPGQWLKYKDTGVLREIHRNHGLAFLSRSLGRNERPNVGGVSIRSRNGAPCRKRGAWSMVKRLRQATNEYAPPPSYMQKYSVG